LRKRRSIIFSNHSILVLGRKEKKRRREERADSQGKVGGILNPSYSAQTEEGKKKKRRLTTLSGKGKTGKKVGVVMFILLPLLGERPRERGKKGKRRKKRGEEKVSKKGGKKDLDPCFSFWIRTHSPWKEGEKKRKKEEAGVRKGRQKEGTLIFSINRQMPGIALPGEKKEEKRAGRNGTNGGRRKKRPFVTIFSI